MKSINLDIKYYRISDLSIREDNPQVMTDEELVNLAHSIEEDGFNDPLLIAEGSKEGKPYEIISGAHRSRGATIAGLTEVPCINLGNLDEKQRLRILTRANIRGRFDKKKLQRLVAKLLEEGLTDDAIREELLVPKAELEMAIKSTRDSIEDPKMKKAFDEASVNIKTIEDISRVLNEIFQKYGKTLDLSFIIFDYDKKKNLWIKCDKELWAKLELIMQKCEEEKTDINVVLKSLLEGYGK